MAKYLIRFVFVGAVLQLNIAFAEVLRDPTMPPASFGITNPDALQAAAGPILQSVTLGTATKYAMISGETVMLGQKYQNYVLVQLKADEAKLRAKDGTSLVLTMDFQALKKPQNMNKGK
jgi:hypothetical protein